MAPIEINGILDELKLQRDILRDVGYGRSARATWKASRLFRDSIICLNLNEEFEKHPCNECVLWEWVPDKHRYEQIPCHHIPIDEQGRSIAQLEAAGKRTDAEEALLAWSDATIQRLAERLEKSIV